MRYKRGDIVLVLFPNSDLRSAKRRPALVVQADNLNTGLPQVVVAMITSNLTRAGHPSRVLITLSSALRRQTGLLSDSVIVTDNLATVAETEIVSVLGIWPDMPLIDNALRHTFGLQ